MAQETKSCLISPTEYCINRLDMQNARPLSWHWNEATCKQCLLLQEALLQLTHQGVTKPWNRSEGSSWEPKNPGIGSSQHWYKTRSREFQILCSLHNKWQRVAAQSVKDLRVIYKSRPKRQTGKVWLREKLSFRTSKVKQQSFENKPECHFRHRQPNRSTCHRRTRFWRALQDVQQTNNIVKLPDRLNV